MGNEEDPEPRLQCKRLMRRYRLPCDPGVNNPRARQAPDSQGGLGLLKVHLTDTGQELGGARPRSTGAGK